MRHIEPSVLAECTLHEALAIFGIYNQPSLRLNRRDYYWSGVFMGAFTASEGWALVSELAGAA